MQQGSKALHNHGEQQLHPCISPWTVTSPSSQVLKYLRQIAVITPYAQFRFQYTAQDERNSVAVTFARRTLKMPVPPAVRTHQTMLHAGLLSRAAEDHHMLCSMQCISHQHVRRLKRQLAPLATPCNDMLIWPVTCRL